MVVGSRTFFRFKTSFQIRKLCHFPSSSYSSYMKPRLTRQKMVVNGRTYYPRIPIQESLSSYQAPEDIQPASLPVGRVSVDHVTFGQMVRELSGEMSSACTVFPLEYLDLMHNLSLVNPDVAQMVDNIVQLGNTGHKVMIETENEDVKSDIIDELNRFGQVVFSRYGGVDGFINSSLAQIARGGAISVEWVINETLTGIERAVFVPLKEIRFLLDRESREYRPHQKTADLTEGDAGLIPLNILTFQYCPLQVLDNSPYAVPPILSALESIVIQRDIIKNLRFISKKMGLLGFVNFLIKAPKQIPGESSEKYVGRCQTFLDQQAERMKHNYRDGIAVGFMDAFTVEHHSITGSAQGAKELFEMNEQQVFSGLKADPALHGRTYSTTETYAGVVYEKMLSIITNYQRTVKAVLEYGYRLHLRLQGLDYKDLWVEFEPSQSLNAERDEQTYGAKLTNLKLLYDQGIIDQNQFAQEAGYDAPAEQEPISSSLPVAPAVEGSSKNQTQVAFKFNKSSGRYVSAHCDRKQMIIPSQKTVDESVKNLFDEYMHELMHTYYQDDRCDIHQLAPADLTPSQKKVQEFQKFYFAEVFPIIKGASETALGTVRIFLKEFDFTTGDSELFANGVLETTTRNFGDELADSVLTTRIFRDLTRIYRFFRLEDTDPFGGKFPIKPSFELVDRQAVRFLRDSDNFYFGRYFSDPQTQKSLKKWLVDEYLQSGRNLRDPGELDKFFKRFKGRVAREDFRILRVVETSTNRARNWGNIFTVQQAQAASIEITGPIDNLTCPWCKSMIGKKFRVDPVVQQIKDIMSRDPEDLPQLNPFLPGKIHPIVVKEISEDQLLAQGIALPPYHPHCRHGYVVDRFK